SPMKGFRGDSVATALFANGIRIFSRSIKYHRPRGLYSLDGESGNTLVTINGECNVNAERTPLRQGMRVRAQNYLGSVERDLLGILDRFDHFMPAGFYYRTFYKPAFMWPLSVEIIRKIAGTGKIDPDKIWSNDDFQELYLNAEVAVLGGGPAGMKAALVAAEQGLRVVLFEARPWLGGFYDWRTRRYNDSDPLFERGLKLAEKVRGHQYIRVLLHTFVTNLTGDNLITAFQVGDEQDPFVQRYVEIRPTSVVVATGCTERPLIFQNNDRPGIMQAACALRLARTYGLLPGTRAVFSVGDDLGLEAAIDLYDMGLQMAAVADARKDGHDPELVQALKDRGIPLFANWAASSAKGNKVVKGVVLGSLSSSGTKIFPCDLLVASAGLSPVSAPLSTIGAKFAYDPHTNFFLPTELPPRVFPAGRMLGYTDPASIETSGEVAGLKAVRSCGLNTSTTKAESALQDLPGPEKGCNIVHGPNIGSGNKAFICFDEDGTYKIARQCVEQGLDLPELAKRFGVFGLGPSQGGIPNHNLPLVLAELRGTGMEGLLPTTTRSPFVPVLFATVAGPNYQIFKRTPMHRLQEKPGVIFRRTGIWQRVRYFSNDLTSRDEIMAVRNSVGIIDVSTLGKFRLFGPDALKALQRVYISDMSKVKTGKLKYSAMLNHDGMIVDDGVVTQIGDNDFYFTTSTGRAGNTVEWFRYHTKYENWEFHLVNLTDTLAAINLAGPKSREVLSRLTDEDISNEAFPYMGYRELTVAGKIPVRALRVGFVGELSYELHFPASYGETLWNMLLEAGEEFGIRPFGLEAQFTLRLEKGHIIIGQDTEQRVNLLDVGLGFLWDRNDKASKKIGAPALAFTEGQKGRLKLVGVRMDNALETPGDGAVIRDGNQVAGYLCSSRYSPTLEQSIAMALVTDHMALEGTRLTVYQNDNNKPVDYKATVVSMPFYDPEGKRLRQ
ncbi:MAG: glycine cleavage T protein (aminomethyl transferase), partial [Deltaproteobacteria bacterium]